MSIRVQIFVAFVLGTWLSGLLLAITLRPEHERFLRLLFFLQLPGIGTAFTVWGDQTKRPIAGTIAAIDALSYSLLAFGAIRSYLFLRRKVSSDA
jgi:hypothetical protein